MVTTDKKRNISGDKLTGQKSTCETTSKKGFQFKSQNIIDTRERQNQNQLGQKRAHQSSQ